MTISKEEAKKIIEEERKIGTYARQLSSTLGNPISFNPGKRVKSKPTLDELDKWDD